MQTPTRSVQIAVGGYAATYQPAAANASGAPNATITVPVTITNVGTAVWQPGVINASYHLVTPSGAVFVWDGVRTKLAGPLDKGQGATVLLLTADSLAGAAWPRDAIDAIHTVPRDASAADVFRRVDEIARTQPM